MELPVLGEIGLLNAAIVGFTVLIALLLHLSMNAGGSAGTRLDDGAFDSLVNDADGDDGGWDDDGEVEIQKKTMADAKADSARLEAAQKAMAAKARAAAEAKARLEKAAAQDSAKKEKTTAPAPAQAPPASKDAQAAEAKLKAEREASDLKEKQEAEASEAARIKDEREAATKVIAMPEGMLDQLKGGSPKSSASFSVYSTRY